jgi:hypothetical protein
MNALAALTEPAVSPEIQALQGESLQPAYNESASLHKPDKTVADYVAQAGGTRKEAA